MSLWLRPHSPVGKDHAVTLMLFWEQMCCAGNWFFTLWGSCLARVLLDHSDLKATKCSESGKKVFISYHFQVQKYSMGETNMMDLNWWTYYQCCGNNSCIFLLFLILNKVCLWECYPANTLLGTQQKAEQRQVLCLASWVRGLNPKNGLYY